MSVTILKSLALSGLVAIWVFGCGAENRDRNDRSTEQSQREPVRFPVEVQPVEERVVEYAISAVGSVEAFEQVVVTSRVAGVIEKTRFQEGDFVTPETVLVEIEPERFELAVRSARAALGRAEAALAEARSGLERRERLNQTDPDLVRAEEVDSWRARVAVAEADVAERRAGLELAELNARDARVRPPVSGIVQSRNLETGRYVQPGTVVATLVQRDPLLLRFRVPERNAIDLRVGQPVRFRVRGDSTTFHEGRIQLVSAAADPRDRMVNVTARIVSSADPSLRPGAFVEVEAPVGGRPAAPVVPQTAIRPSERGFLVYVVEDGVARERVLELGLRTTEGQVEVRSGLKPGDLLVVRGAEALRDGAAVRLVSTTS